MRPFLGAQVGRKPVKYLNVSLLGRDLGDRPDGAGVLVLDLVDAALVLAPLEDVEGAAAGVVDVVARERRNGAQVAVASLKVRDGGLIGSGYVLK